MLWLQLIALAGALYRLLFADRGAFPYRPGIRIYEPKQRSLIAWNGQEEIMLKKVCRRSHGQKHHSQQLAHLSGPALVVLAGLPPGGTTGAHAE